MAKNGRRNEGNGLEDRTLEFEHLSSAELREKLRTTVLSKGERKLVRDILKGCRVVWISEDKTTLVKREPKDPDIEKESEGPDFKILHHCLGSDVEQGVDGYDDAVSDAAWICGEKI